jgi:competence ComEA-like helix-hairpin-helix protein
LWKTFGNTELYIFFHKVSIHLTHLLALCTFSMQSYKPKHCNTYNFMKISKKYIFLACYVSILLTFLIPLISCAKRERVFPTRLEPHNLVRPERMNLNTASLAELKKLPRIGEVTAHKIIDFREKYGKFHRIEEIMLVDKMGEKHFREIRQFMTAE